jgi:CheY-like chemotaxis protein
LTFVERPVIEGRVLVVEHDIAIRTMLLTVLEVAGYEVRGVRNGVDAFAMLGNWRPDVIVLDLLLVMDGQAFLERRLAIHDIANIPVVVVTPTTAPLPPVRHLGVRAVLRRPHDVNRFRALIADAIYRRSSDPSSPPKLEAGGGLH